MKIAISASGKDLDAPINQRFGRCEYFLVIDTDTMETQSFSNENGSQSSGAGIQAADFVISKGVGAVLTGNCGPKAMDVFAAENIAVYTGRAGTVRQAVEAFKNDNLAASSSPETRDTPSPGGNRDPEPRPRAGAWAAAAVWAAAGVWEKEAAEVWGVVAAGAWAAAEALAAAAEQTADLTVSLSGSAYLRNSLAQVVFYGR